MTRRSCKTVYAGKLPIGGGAPVSVQSMLNVPAADIAGSVRQAKALAAAGCQLIRAAVPKETNKDAVRLIAALKEAVDVPIVADIHFDYTLALEAVAAGVDKVRINPGNIGDDARVKAVADACRARKVPIRIGVNSGSLEKSILAKYGHPTAEALRDSALYHASLLERFDFDDIVISIKSSDVSTMMQACRLIAAACPYPLHLGVTEAGLPEQGKIKSAIGGNKAAGTAQIRRRHRRSAGGGYRRHHPRVPHRRSASRGAGGTRAARSTRAAFRRAAAHFLPDLRQNRCQSHRYRKGGGSPPL